MKFKIYDIILNGYEIEEEDGLDLVTFVDGIDWSAIEMSEQEIAHHSHKMTYQGIEVYYDYGADYFFFCPAE